MSLKTIEATGKRTNQNTGLEEVQDYSMLRVKETHCSKETCTVILKLDSN